jgi:hypothetical protein
MLIKWDPIKHAHISCIKSLCFYIGLMMTPIEGRNILPEIPNY